MPTMTRDRKNCADDDGSLSGVKTNALIADAADFGIGILAAAGRKAAVQAVTYAARDWFDGLKAEHKGFIALFDLLERTTTEDTKSAPHCCSSLSTRPASTRCRKKTLSTAQCVNTGPRPKPTISTTITTM